MRTALVCSLVATGLTAWAGSADAQQIVAIPEDTPVHVGPGTQGFIAYAGPEQLDYYWLCDTGVPAREVADDVHMRQSGDLASFTFRYYTLGPPATGSVTAILRVYGNDATNSILPSPASLIASYTVPNLPYADGGEFVHTYDVPVPVAVPKDLWVGIELVLPPGAVGSMGLSASGVGSLPRYGTSSNLVWFGQASCDPVGTIFDLADFGLVGAQNLTVRVFPEVTCEFPVPNGDFETGTLASWTGVGTHAVLDGFTAQTPPTSGSRLARVDSIGAAASTIASFLGVSYTTIDALAPEAFTNGAAMRQTISVSAGDTLSFDWNLLTDEATPSAWNDFGFLVLSDGTSELLADTFFAPFYPAQIGASYLGDPLAVETGWQHYERTFTAPGTITVGLGAANQRDETYNSALAIDCVELVPGPDVNEPPTCSIDLTLARASFLEPSPGAFVVTEGETLVVLLEGTDPDGDHLMVEVDGLPPSAVLAPTSGPTPLQSVFTWTPSATDKGGAPYSVTVTFRDPTGESSACSFSIADVNLRPMCSASSQTLECSGPEGAFVTLDGSATDPDDPESNLTYAWFVSDDGVTLDDPSAPGASGTFPIGVTMATLTVADSRGGVAVCDVLITVQDTTPPEVMCTTDVAALWPPNHGLRPVRLVVTATDVCADPSGILPIAVRVSSSEPDDASGNGDGATTGDVNGLDGHAAAVDVTASLAYDALLGQWTGTILLRSERAGTGTGRKYTLDVSAVDSMGNAATTSSCIVVPHDRRVAAN